MKKLSIKTRRILAAAGGAAIVLALLLALDAAIGDPVSRALAERKALRYAQTLHPDEVFAVAKSEGGPWFRYYIRVQAQEDPDAHYDVICGWWGLEDAGAGTPERLLWNTVYRMGNEAADLAAAELASEVPELDLQPAFGSEQRKVELDLGWQPDTEYPAVGEEFAAYFTADAPFTKALLEKVPSRFVAQIRWHGQPTQEDLQSVLQTVKHVLEKNGMPVTWYDITLLPDEEADHDDLRARMVGSGTVHRDDIPAE